MDLQSLKSNEVTVAANSIKATQNAPTPLSCGNLILTSSASSFATLHPHHVPHRLLTILKAVVVWYHHLRNPEGWKAASRWARVQLFLINTAWPAVPYNSRVNHSVERWQSPWLQTNTSARELPHRWLRVCVKKCCTNNKKLLDSKQQEQILSSDTNVNKGQDINSVAMQMENLSSLPIQSFLYCPAPYWPFYNMRHITCIWADFQLWGKAVSCYLGQLATTSETTDWDRPSSSEKQLNR